MSTFFENRQHLKDAVSSVLNAGDESALVSIVNGVYVVFNSTLFFKDFEFVLSPIFSNMPSYLSQQAKSKIYEKSGEAHLYFIRDEKNESRFDKALERYNEALKLSPKHSGILAKKGWIT